MEQDQPSSNPRKVRFTPKRPPLRKAKSVKPKTELAREAEEDEVSQILLKAGNDLLERKGPKVKSKSPAHVAFGPGDGSIRSYGINGEGSLRKSSRLSVKGSSSSDGQIPFTSSSTAQQDETFERAYQNKKKEYVEPWDYNHDYYPVTLPLRKPYSGDPEILDEAEFGDGAKEMEYDENAVNHALELGLLEENTEEGKMIFFQLPLKLPLSSVVKEGAAPASAKKGKEVVGSSSRARESKTSFSLEELPEGFIGKMLIYKSGAVKLKLGSTLFDVSSGVDCKFAQDVVAINTVDGHCCMLREVEKRAVVTPDVNSLLEEMGS